MSHRIATVTLSSVSPYSASRAHFTPKLEKELAAEAGSKPGPKPKVLKPSR